MADADQWAQERREDKAEAHSSFTVASRSFNAVLLALAGAVLAGIGQLAGSGALAAKPAPTAVNTALLGAVLSLLAGVLFVGATFIMSFCTYRLKYGRPLKTEQRHYVSGEERVNLAAWRSRMETALPFLLAAQTGTWLTAATFYSFTLYWVSRYVPA